MTCYQKPLGIKTKVSKEKQKLQYATKIDSVGLQIGGQPRAL